jgi:iron complex outermembrane receptor protein
MQHSFRLGDSHEIVWGAGERVSAYDLTNTATAGFMPASRSLNLADIFIQDTIHLIDRVNLTVGMKLEKAPYIPVEPLPSARLSWKPLDNLLLWSAVSRAVRAPTPFDRDIFEKIGPTTVLTAAPAFTSEKLIAYELGTRIEPMPRMSLSVSTFYNTYDELRSIEFAQTGTIFPLQFGNMMVGDSYGAELWASYGITDWWRLAAGFNWLHENLRFKSGSSGLGGIAQAGNDPHHQLSLRSSVDLTHDLTFDTDLRGVAALPNPAVPSYYELNARLGWKVTDRLTLSLTGNNLLHAHHVEFAASAVAPAVEIPRSVYLSAQWRF